MTAASCLARADFAGDQLDCGRCKPSQRRPTALLGMGVAVLLFADMSEHLKCGALRRVLPGWYVDLGKISLYFASTKLLPAKTRAFVDYVTKSLRSQRTAKRYCAT